MWNLQGQLQLDAKPQDCDPHVPLRVLREACLSCSTSLHSLLTTQAKLQDAVRFPGNNNTTHCQKAFDHLTSANNMTGGGWRWWTAVGVGGNKTALLLYGRLSFHSESRVRPNGGQITESCRQMPFIHEVLGCGALPDTRGKAPESLDSRYPILGQMTPYCHPVVTGK